MSIEFMPNFYADDPRRLADQHEFLRNRLIGAIRDAKQLRRETKRSIPDVLGPLQGAFADFVRARTWCHVSSGSDQLIAEAEQMISRLAK